MQTRVHKRDAPRHGEPSRAVTRGGVLALHAAQAARRAAARRR